MDLANWALRTSPQRLNISSISVFDKTRDPEIPITLRPIYDLLFGIVVSTCDYYPGGPHFDSRLYLIIFSGNIGSGKGPTQDREDNWIAT